jgi:hypothetical protein
MESPLAAGVVTAMHVVDEATTTANVALLVGDVAHLHLPVKIRHSLLLARS